MKDEKPSDILEHNVDVEREKALDDNKGLFAEKVPHIRLLHLRSANENMKRVVSNRRISFPESKKPFWATKQYFRGVATPRGLLVKQNTSFIARVSRRV